MNGTPHLCSAQERILAGELGILHAVEAALVGNTCPDLQERDIAQQQMVQRPDIVAHRAGASYTEARNALSHDDKVVPHHPVGREVGEPHHHALVASSACASARYQCWF